MGEEFESCLAGGVLTQNQGCSNQKVAGKGVPASKMVRSQILAPHPMGLDINDRVNSCTAAGFRQNKESK